MTRESLAADRRAALHARLAAALAESEGASQSLIATHYEAAGQSAEAHRHAVLAADAALRLYDTVGGIDAAGRRGASCAVASVRWRACACGLAELAEAAGHYEDAEALCDLALNWYEGSEDPVQAIRLKRMRTARADAARAGCARDAELTLRTRGRGDPRRCGRGARVDSAHEFTDARSARRPAEAQRVAEECLEIAERCGDPVLLSDSYNRLGVVSAARPIGARARDALRARARAHRATRRRRASRRGCFTTSGRSSLSASRWDDARRSLRRGGRASRVPRDSLTLWARASLNLGVLAMRSGRVSTRRRRHLSEALRLSAEAQHTELQLVTTYNLGQPRARHAGLRTGARHV